MAGAGFKQDGIAFNKNYSGDSAIYKHACSSAVRASFRSGSLRRYGRAEFPTKVKNPAGIGGRMRR